MEAGGVCSPGQKTHDRQSSHEVSREQCRILWITTVMVFAGG